MESLLIIVNGEKRGRKKLNLIIVMIQICIQTSANEINDTESQMTWLFYIFCVHIRNVKL